MIELVIASIFLVLLIFMLLYRIVKGPTNSDRLVALESVFIVFAAILVLLGTYFNRVVYVDAALVLGIFGFAGTLMIAKHLGGKS
jgi:multisubunit Na+/H+ antiporter MnhF subunit